MLTYIYLRNYIFLESQTSKIVCLYLSTLTIMNNMKLIVLCVVLMAALVSEISAISAPVEELHQQPAAAVVGQKAADPLSAGINEFLSNAMQLFQGQGNKNPSSPDVIGKFIQELIQGLKPKGAAEKAA